MGDKDVTACDSASEPRLSLVIEEVQCPLCGGGDYVPFLQAPAVSAVGQMISFRIVRCRACKLCFTNPRPTAATIGAFYGAAYEPHRGDAVGRLQPTALERRLLPFSGQGRLLDFGCGGGRFLARMRAAGWDVLGLDMAADVVRRINDELRLPALAGTLPHPDLTGPAFDVVTMWQSLEHLHDPLAVLRAARDLLLPGGRLIVAVPNLDCGAFHLLGNAWFGIDLPRHLIHFTSDTLVDMIRRAGLEVSRVMHTRHADWVRRSADTAAAMNRKSWWTGLLRLRLASSLLSRWWQWTGQADAIVVEARKQE